MSVRILTLALVGCGRIGFDASASDARVDTTADAHVCAGFGPWSTPSPLTELDGPVTNEYGPSIAADGLTLYFDSDRMGSADIYIAKRPSATEPFGAPARVDALATGDYEGDSTITTDDLDIYFYDADTECLKHANRASPSSMFTTPTTLLCTYAGPFVMPDGLTLYYNSRLDGVAEGELYVSTRASRLIEFGPGTRIAELATGGGRGFPSLSGDGLSMYFEQEAGALDLMETHRASPASPWDPPVPISALNSPDEDGDADISADGTEMFFESRRGTTQADLYHATRACL
jgi:Tol biopolymer transport system component